MAAHHCMPRASCRFTSSYLCWRRCAPPPLALTAPARRRARQPPCLAPRAGMAAAPRCAPLSRLAGLCRNLPLVIPKKGTATSLVASCQHSILLHGFLKLPHLWHAFHGPLASTAALSFLHACCSPTAVYLHTLPSLLFCLPLLSKCLPCASLYEKPKPSARMAAARFAAARCCAIYLNMLLYQRYENTLAPYCYTSS